MPFTKVSVDRLYQKTGSRNEKKTRHVQQLADDIFADLLPTLSGEGKRRVVKPKKIHRQYPGPSARSVPVVFILLGLFLTACAEKPMGPKEEQAIKLVQGFAPGEGYFSVVSNVEQKAQDARRTGNTWSQKSWQAGLQSQTDRIIDALSQYFNIFEAPGGRWVRLTYMDNQGAYEAVWDVDIYRKRVVPKDELARELTTPADAQRAVLPPHLTGPGTWAGSD